MILGILVSIAGILLPFLYVGEGGFLFLPHALTALALGIVLMVAMLKVSGFYYARLIIFVAALGGAAVFLRLPGNWPGATATWVLAVLAGTFFNTFAREMRKSRSMKR